MKLKVIFSDPVALALPKRRTEMDTKHTAVNVGQ
jgi:hypothetical protein